MFVNKNLKVLILRPPKLEPFGSEFRTLKTHSINQNQAELFEKKCAPQKITAKANKTQS